MNLLQASYYKVQSDIHGGGPGSGRHPGGGAGNKNNARYRDRLLVSDKKPMSQRAHRTLTNAGFKFKGTNYDEQGRSEGISTYTHPKHGEVDVYQGGMWNHSGKNGASGDSYSELKEHISKVK